MAATHEYRVLGRLGAGGMAAVYLGSMQTPAGERRVAIKRLLEGRELDPDDNERFIAEARLVFRLTHANICQVIDLGTNDQGTFILMEYVEGLDLRGLLRKLRESGRQLDVASAVHVAREIAQALDYAHRRTDENGHPLQLVHGDVTPQNVLISIEGEVKLADFGIASATRAHAPGNSLRGGTPGFMAPEVMEGGNDHRADIFSLGVTLYAALGGKVRKDAPIDLAGLATARSEIGELQRIIERATSVHREDRFLSAGELEQALAFHLARRYPEFTPSVLAGVVRSCGARVLAPAPHQEESATLVSLVQPPAILGGATIPDAAQGTSGTSVRRHTAPLSSSHRSRTPIYIAAALLMSATMLIGFTFASHTHRWAPIPRPSPLPPASVAELPAPPSLAPLPMKKADVPEPAPTPTKTHARHAAPPPPASGTGWLTINATPWGAILLDGKRIADQTPLYRYPVPAGPHTIVVVDPETKKRAAPRRVVVRAGEAQVVGFRW